MDLSFVRPLYESAPGKWCSAYLDVSRDSEDAISAVDLRWRGLAEDLRGQGADQATLDAIGRAIHDYRGSDGLALFGRDGAVALTVALPAPPPRDTAAFCLLPHALPLARLLEQRVPWLRALVDRTGADLLAVPAAGRPRTARVTDQEYPVRKTDPGGWSQSRYQRSAELSWDRTAALISDRATKLAGRVRARVLVIAGDVRERNLVAERLTEELPKMPLVQTEAGARAAGAREEPLEEATREVVRAEALRLREETLDAYRREHNRGGAAVTGLPDVVSALRQGKVDALLVDADQLAADARLCGGPEPLQIALTEAELALMNVTAPWSAHVDDILLRAAAATEADLLAVSADEVPLTDGVGAHLRY
jgi:nucleotide-binding universal stress UspA family protein